MFVIASYTRDLLLLIDLYCASETATLERINAYKPDRKLVEKPSALGRDSETAQVELEADRATALKHIV